MAIKPIVPFGFLKASLDLGDCMTMNFQAVQPFERNEAFCFSLKQKASTRLKNTLVWKRGHGQ